MFEAPANPATQSATQRVYLQLRREIIAGALPPGQRLKVESIKLRHDTGASPVREALSLLTSDQLVERIDQRGFRVAPASRDQFNEILNLRCTLESLALRESMTRGDRAWADNLVLAHHHLGRAGRTDSAVFEELHKRFHMALLSACNSPILLKFCHQLYDLNVRYRFLAGTSKNYQSRDVAAEHQTILDAALDRDADRAAAALTEHYRRTGAFLAELIT